MVARRSTVAAALLILASPQDADCMVVRAVRPLMMTAPAAPSVSMDFSTSIETAPMEPNDSLSESDVVQLICEGLRQNDTPRTDAGIERLFHFTTPMGRVAIAPPPPRAGLQGGVTLEYFLENAASKALGSLCFCNSFKLIGTPQITPPSQARGSLATVLVEVGNSPLEDESNVRASLKALLKAPDDFLAAVLEAERTGQSMPDEVPDEALVKSRFWFSLEQQRRPPQLGCWLLKEMLPVEKTKFQELNDGGEEFEGDDSG